MSNSSWTFTKFPWMYGDSFCLLLKIRRYVRFWDSGPAPGWPDHMRWGLSFLWTPSLPLPTPTAMCLLGSQFCDLDLLNCMCSQLCSGPDIGDIGLPIAFPLLSSFPPKVAMRHFPPCPLFQPPFVSFWLARPEACLR